MCSPLGGKDTADGPCHFLKFLDGIDGYTNGTGQNTLRHTLLNDPTAQAIAYVDDLLSLSSHLPSLQQHADLLAAFAQIFKLDLVTSKFRAYEFPYHKVHPKQPNSTPLTTDVCHQRHNQSTIC